MWCDMQRSLLSRNDVFNALVYFITIGYKSLKYLMLRNYAIAHTPCNVIDRHAQPVPHRIIDVAGDTPCNICILCFGQGDEIN